MGALANKWCSPRVQSKEATLCNIQLLLLLPTGDSSSMRSGCRLPRQSIWATHPGRCSNELQLLLLRREISIHCHAAHGPDCSEFTALLISFYSYCHGTHIKLGQAFHGRNLELGDTFAHHALMFAIQVCIHFLHNVGFGKSDQVKPQPSARLQAKWHRFPSRTLFFVSRNTKYDSARAELCEKPVNRRVRKRKISTR